MIVSTTLVGPGTVELLDAALASVAEQVDHAILIQTSSEVNGRDVHHAAVRGGFRGRYSPHPFVWINDFSAARNYAFDVAAGSGATWSVTLDTDERLAFDGVDLRKRLTETDVDLFLAEQVDGSYAKERFFRLSKVAIRGLGPGLRWQGATHEYLPILADVKRETISGVAFSELAKTPEQLRAKFERDKGILLGEVGAGPNSNGLIAPTPANARAWYYLGDCYHGLAEIDDAIFAFETCAEHSAWNEEAAWARYRAAELECKRGRFDHALEHAALGLAKHAGIAELGWIAGLSAYRAGRFEQAVHWAMISISAGVFSGTGRWHERHGFRYPPALWEGPYDILAHAYDRLAMPEQAARAKAKHAAAEALRLKLAPPT